MGKHLHFVHNDEIWKDHVRREMQSFTHKWPDKWGFLTTEYKKMNENLTGRPVKTPAKFSSQPKSPTPSGKREDVKLPPIENKDTNRQTAKFPVTTASLIGWRTTHPGCQLETYARYAPKARGRIGILKIFDWPQQVL